MSDNNEYHDRADAAEAQVAALAYLCDTCKARAALTSDVQKLVEQFRAGKKALESLRQIAICCEDCAKEASEKGEERAWRSVAAMARSGLRSGREVLRDAIGASTPASDKAGER